MTHFVYILSKMIDIDYSSTESSVFETFVMYKLKIMDFVYSSLFDVQCIRQHKDDIDQGEQIY